MLAIQFNHGRRFSAKVIYEWPTTPLGETQEHGRNVGYRSAGRESDWNLQFDTELALEIGAECRSPCWNEIIRDAHANSAADDIIGLTHHWVGRWPHEQRRA